MADKYIKVQFKADTDGLTSGLNKADNDLQTFGDRIGKWSKVAAGAFAAAGAAAVAYAGKLAIDGVKSAIEDEAAQAKLAATLKNVTKATDAQIAATEDYITQTALATGVADDELRPALDRLVRSGLSVKDAQKAMTLALDVSAGSGKSLEAVSNALGKAYEGNTTALGRLGIGLSSAQLKTMSMDEVTAQLGNTFRDQASKQADTFDGKMRRLSVAFDEGKETVGAYILDAITPLAEGFLNNVVPALSKTSDTIGKSLGPAFAEFGNFIKSVFGPILTGMRSAWDSITSALARNEDKLRPLYDLLKAVGGFIADTLAPLVGKTLGAAWDTFGKALGKVIDLVASFVSGIKTAVTWVTTLIEKIGNINLNPFKGASLDTGGGPTIGALRPYVAPAPTTDWSTTPVTYNVTVNGAIDSESTARQIVGVLNDSAGRTGNYATLGTSYIGLASAAF